MGPGTERCTGPGPVIAGPYPRCGTLKHSASCPRTVALYQQIAEDLLRKIAGSAVSLQQAYGQEIPGQGGGMFNAMVDNVIRGVERKQIPSGQYQAVLLDEGHDFQPEWFKLVMQMVDPETNSLLVLYDSAQNIYKKS